VSIEVFVDNVEHTVDPVDLYSYSDIIAFDYKALEKSLSSTVVHRNAESRAELLSIRV
jgi:hypothetical protein